jgi:F0F1-type ATP synthase membrane subunit b/b'
MSHTFLDQVREAEEKARKVVEKALEHKQHSLQVVRQRLAKESKENIQAGQEKIKQDLQIAREEARRVLVVSIEKATQDAKMLETEKGGLVNGLMGNLETFLLKELRASA